MSTKKTMMHLPLIVLSDAEGIRFNSESKNLLYKIGGQFVVVSNADGIPEVFDDEEVGFLITFLTSIGASVGEAQKDEKCIYYEFLNVKPLKEYVYSLIKAMTRK